MRLVCGVGINDADYKVTNRRDGWTCPIYSMWSNMINRCYSKNKRPKDFVYDGVTVCDDWLRFSNFREWVLGHDWVGKQIDKDLLSKGKRTYSPDTCCFISKKANLFIIDLKRSRGKYKIGASYNKNNGRFASLCRDPFSGKMLYNGYFDTDDEAHKAWLKKKLELAIKLAENETDPRASHALIDKFTNYKH